MVQEHEHPEHDPKEKDCDPKHKKVVDDPEQGLPDSGGGEPEPGHDN